MNTTSLMNRFAIDAPTRSIFRTVLAVSALILLFCATLFVRGWQPMGQSATQIRSVVAPNMPTSTQIENQFGVRFLGVDVTAGGGMLQIRYQVLDSAKTEALHDEQTAPFVLDGAGHKYADPGIVGHSHIGKTKEAGTTDFILLANAQGGIEAGMFVTIQVGTFTLTQVPVR
ncbi:MAG: hypothetical protein WCH38_00185 [Actinomycetota bacterium]